MRNVERCQCAPHDGDLLLAAKEIARLERSSAGEVVSRLLRQSRTGAGANTVAGAIGVARLAVAGFLPFPSRPGVMVTNDLVNRLRDEEGL